jgi:hypothetical protein
VDESYDSHGSIQEWRNIDLTEKESNNINTYNYIITRTNAYKLKSTIFWNGTPSSAVVHRSFGETYLPPSSGVKSKPRKKQEEARG